jgi:peptidoglycan hydrolase-like protein with peptidoglycan-binding domain
VNEVQYPVPDLSDVVKSQEETSIRSISTAQDDAPPPPIIDQGSGDAATVRYLQTLLVERFGYKIAIDGDFGPATAAAVQSFKQSNNLGGNPRLTGIPGVRYKRPTRNHRDRERNESDVERNTPGGQMDRRQSAERGHLGDTHH